MNDIKSLDDLIKTLTQTEAKDYVKIVKNMNIPVEDFEKYIHFKEDGYARNCIAKTDLFELILLCWKKGDATAIHGHDNQRCWVYLVDGEMTEVRYKEDENGNLSASNKIKAGAGALVYMHDSMGYHTLENHTNQNAITLHLYMSPVDKCEVYNVEKKCFEEKILSYDTVG